MFIGMVHPNSKLDITGEQIIRKCLTIKGKIRFNSLSTIHKYRVMLYVFIADLQIPPLLKIDGVNHHQICRFSQSRQNETVT